MTARKSLRVNPAVCDGSGYCAELLPDMIDLDEWGFPILSRDATVPDELLDAAREAVKFCPRRALALVDAPASVDQPRLRTA
jgi:ferredoxin